MSANNETAITTAPLVPMTQDQVSMAYALASHQGYYTSAIAGQTATPEQVLALHVGDRIPLSELLGQELAIVHVMMCPVETVQEDGELTSYYAIRMLTEDGVLVTCGASSVARVLAAIASAYGKPPWVPPVRVTFVQKTAGARRWYAAKSIKQ